MSTSMKRHRKNKMRQMSTYLQSLEEQLLQQVDAILAEPSTHIQMTVTYQRLYKYVEFLCRDKHQSHLSNTLNAKIQRRINELRGEYTAQSSQGDGISSLAAFVTLYDVLESKLKALEKIYLYLDRTYLLHHPMKETVVRSGLLYLYGTLVEDGSWKVIFQDFTDCLNGLRTNYTENTANELHRFWIRFRKVSQWGDVEKEVLEETRAFYHDVHSEIIEGHAADRVFDVFLNAIVKEDAFWKHCNESVSFIRGMKTILVSELVFQEFGKDATRFVLPMFQEKKHASLNALYQFIENSSTTQRKTYMLDLRVQWGNYVMDYVTSLIKTQNDDDLVEKLVKSKKDMNIVLEKFFDNNSELEQKLRDSFQSALNQAKGAKINKKLLRYIDSFFRNAGENREENFKVIQDVFLIFKSTTNKESLINTDYRRDLARRLLQQTTKDIPLEIELLELIEQEIDSEIVGSLKSMFTDIEESDILKTLHNNPSAIDFTPLILKKDNWPSNDAKAHFPADLSTLLVDFQNFYISTNEKYSKRVLKWSPALGNMSITAHFPSGDKELQVTTSQGLVLLMFNDYDSLTFDQVRKSTRMDAKSVASALYSLSQGKYRILKKENDTYTMNGQFKEKRKNIRVKHIQVKIKDGEVVEEEEQETSLTEQRYVEAAIVRYLKRVGQCSQKQLSEKLLEDLVVDTAGIKKAVETMIDHEYIARVDRETYMYVP